jgi:hypothetical protein
MRCERMRATIATSVCIRRQERSVISGKMGNEVFYECRDCEQGRRIAEAARAGIMGPAVDGMPGLDEDVRRLRERAMNIDRGQQVVSAEQAPKTKVCSRCKKDKAVERFSRRTESPDGLQRWCKDCFSGLRGGGETDAQSSKTDGGETAISTTAQADEKQAEYLTENCAATCIIIDLSAYPDLHDEIKRIAAEEERTPEAQVRDWLRCRILGHQTREANAA